MTSLRTLARCFGAAWVACFVLGCGEDGKGITDNDHCPEQTLYTYVYADAGKALPDGGVATPGHWAVRKAGSVTKDNPNGTKFDPTELAALEAALRQATQIGRINPPPLPPDSVGQRCLTPFGTAYTLDGGSP